MTANVQAAEINPIATFSWLIVPHSSFIASFCKKKLKKTEFKFKKNLWAKNRQQIEV